jgi:hypothetical protein
MSMSLRLLAISAAFAFAGAAFASPQSSMAAPATKTLSSQQTRMGDCNKQATGKKGDERKAFMSSCLKGQTADAPMASPAKMTQQQKMTSCNADAKTKALKGADRKTFMSSCLKNAPATP